MNIFCTDTLRAFQLFFETFVSPYMLFLPVRHQATYVLCLSPEFRHSNEFGDVSRWELGVCA